MTPLSLAAREYLVVAGKFLANDPFLAGSPVMAEFREWVRALDAMPPTPEPDSPLLGDFVSTLAYAGKVAASNATTDQKADLANELLNWSSELTA